jgi:hypothetical protein
MKIFFVLLRGGFNITRIVYFDYGGAHSSVVAACIHAGRLDPENLPSGDKLMKMPYLDKTTPEDFGKIKHIGNYQGDEIYSLGTKYSDSGNLLNDMANLQGVSDQYQFVITSPYVNWTLRIGGWLSRSASLPSLGRPLVISGLRQAYPELCSLVKNTQANQGGMH